MAEMHDINEQHPGFWKQRSIQDACNAYANMEHYNCKGNVISLCHGGRGNNKVCAICDDLEQCSNEYESTKEDAPS